MSDLVRARLNGVETNLSPFFAEKYGAEVLDEPTHNPDGSPRRDTRAGGRKAKPRTTVAAAAKRKTASKRRTAKKTTAATKASGSKAATTAANEKE